LSCFSVSLPSCTTKTPKEQEMEHFEQMLTTARLRSEDSITYIIWNSMSCGGCRNYTARLLQNGGLNDQVKFIVPLSFVNEIHHVSDKVFVDSQGVFDEYYIGIDNIGIIKVYNNKVLSIRNYQANE